MLEGDRPGPKRLPFTLQAQAGVGRLALADLAVGPLALDKLELEVADLGTDPGPAGGAERFQRRRTRLRTLALRLTAAQLEARIDASRRQLAGLGITGVNARLGDGFVSVRARAADGLAAADVSFRVHFVSTGTHLRALASTVRVHGHLPTPGPVLADRILGAILGATDTPGMVERPHARGLCDVEIDLVGAVLWALLPPSGWRLPAVGDIELVGITITRAAAEVSYGPPGSRTQGAQLGVRPQTHQLAAAHDLMHSVDQQLREGHLEEAMRGYRTLLAAGGPEQPLLLERILALASARPAWFFDGLELARQALGRWPQFAPAHAALASITLAQGDAREAASHLAQLAQLASGEGDDDQAAFAALAGARLLRVLDPKSATLLYELALEHDPSSSEAADSLADRYADEQRWAELVRLVRARAVVTPDVARAVQLRLRLADVFVHQLGDPASAQLELGAARELAPDDPAVHEMTATILAASDPAAAVTAWREVVRLAQQRGDQRMGAHAWAVIGTLLAATSAPEAEEAWIRAMALDPLQAEAIAGLAANAAARGDHKVAADYYERLRGIGLPQHVAARHELQLAKALVATGRIDDARTSLRRATLIGGETAAEAHAVLAEVAEASSDREHAGVELGTAIEALTELGRVAGPGDGDRLRARAAQLAILRAGLLDRGGQNDAARAEWERAHELAERTAPALARDAAKVLLDRAGADADAERRWIDAVLATTPPDAERATLLVRRADVRRRERTPDGAAAIADLREALQLVADAGDDAAISTRRRAYQLEAELLAQSGDQRARAQALSSLAKLAERAADRVEVETAAAAAWLAADEPGAALPHGVRAHASLVELGAELPAELRREVLVTLGEAAWRQRAWPDVIRAYQSLIEDPGAEQPRLAAFRHRLAVAADRTGDAPLAIATLRPLVEDPDAGRGAAPELRGQALRLFADLAERAGDLGGAAAALEGFAQLAVESSPSARADAMYRAGELFRRAERAEDAIRCLEATLRISDTHLPALDALETIWRERGDTERVSVILGRKVAATARHPARQKPLLSRLGDLQDQLGRPDVALATHQRALEIDPTWRPSLRFVTLRLREAGQLVAAAGGLAQLAGDLPGDAGVDLAIVARERQLAATALAEVIVGLQGGDSQLVAIGDVARPALERAAIDGVDVTAALATLRGEAPARSAEETTAQREEDTHSGRATNISGSALSLKNAATRARAAGKREDAFASLETANHVNPGDAGVLQELVELALELGDHAAAAKHLTTLADLVAGARRGNTLLELADVYYDHLDDVTKARQAMRSAADSFGAGARRDSTLRMLAAEATSHLAWNITVDALTALTPDRRTSADVANLATAYARSGRDAEAIALVEDATQHRAFDDGGALLAQLRTERDRKSALAKALDERADAAEGAEATTLRDEAQALRESIGEQAARTKTLPGTGGVKVAPASVAGIEPGGADDDATSTRAREPSTPPALARIKLVSVPAAVAIDPAAPEAQADADDSGWQSVLDPMIKSGPIPIATMTTQPIGIVGALASTPLPRTPTPTGPVPVPTSPAPPPSRPVTNLHVARTSTPKGPAMIPTAPTLTGLGVISGTDAASMVSAAAKSADRDVLLAAHKKDPDDAAVLSALLVHLADSDPTLRRQILDEAAKTSHGRALAVALHELAVIARESKDPIRAAALWTRAHDVDPSYPPVWMPLADALASSDELPAARDLYERIAASHDYDEPRRAFAASQAESLGKDHTIVSGEIKPRRAPLPEVDQASELADAGDLRAAILAAETRASAHPDELAPLELLEKLYLEAGAPGDVTAASEAIGRQLLLVTDEIKRSALWRRRARIYRDSLGRDAEAYRCLKEAHACSPADPEIAYQLRTAAMVRGEWSLAASLLYREIAASANPRDRGALHLELALIFDERLDDDAQAQVNFEQALAFDPTIPAAKLPLARRYESIGRHMDAAKLYEDAAISARPADRASLLEAATRCRTAATADAVEPSVEIALERAEAAGDTEAAHTLATTLWRDEPGHPAAFRVLANHHRTSGDLPALSEITAVRASRAPTGEFRATAWLEVARLAEDVGSLDQAARAYDLAIVEDPGNVGALDARGGLAFRLGDYAAAELIYRDLAPGQSVLGDDELAMRRSVIAERLGKDTEALAHAQEAAKAAPARRDIMMRVQELATRIGDLDTALAGARAVLDLVPLDDDDAKLQVQFQLVYLLRQVGNLDAAIAQLERVLRDHPMHAPALEALADVHIARGDWPAATRYLYQLVPLAPNALDRAERLFRLGEAVLVHLGDVDRADDVFLRASDLDPSHVPTLRRLLDVYWRADDPGALVEVATELAEKGSLANGPTAEASLAHALVAAALVGDTALAQRVANALGDHAPRHVAAALAELAGREGRLQISTASTAVTELARRGVLDIAKLRAAAAGTPVANLLTTT